MAGVAVLAMVKIVKFGALAPYRHMSLPLAM
jgi:hypothetical protein